MSPERAAEILLESVGLAGGDGGPPPPPYTGRLGAVTSRELAWDDALAFALEARDGEPGPDVADALAVAATTASRLGLPLDVAVLSAPLTETRSRALAGRLAAWAPAQRILVVEDPALATPSVRARESALAAILPPARAPRLHSVWLAPGLSEAAPGFTERLREGGLDLLEWHGLTAIELGRGGLSLERAACGRRLRIVSKLPARGRRALVVTVAPDARAPAAVPGSHEPPAVQRVELDWAYDPAHDALALAGAGVRGMDPPITLRNAEFIVDVGAGVRTGENLERIVEPLRRALLDAGAPHVEVGGSRKVTEDLSLLPADRQIGQTGVRVNPRALIMLGVSGAPQHLDYIGERTTIVAFNLDPRAPVMMLNEKRERPAVVPVVGDLFETVPRFIEALRRAAGRRAA